MQPPDPLTIREAILSAIQDLKPDRSDPSLQFLTVIGKLDNRFGRPGGSYEQDVLTQWHDLLRTGHIAPGLNLSNPELPFFHLTNLGRRSIDRITRDPANPAGYLRHLGSISRLNPIAQSYLDEGLSCFTSGLYKSAAVMLGAASESLILDLRDTICTRLQALSQVEPKGLDDWRLKNLLDHIQQFISQRKKQLPSSLREEFDAYFSAFTQQIRSGRDEAGHPTSISPVSEDGVHASFLLFPELAKLATNLSHWITEEMQ